MTKIKFEDLGEKKNWVSGRYEDSSSSKTISIISPYFDKEIAIIPDSNYNDLDMAVQGARTIFPDWKRTNIRDRAEVMFRFKTILELNLALIKLNSSLNTSLNSVLILHLFLLL